MLRSNMRHVYIDERWVVDQYLMMERTKTFNELEAENDMRVLELEREMMAESMDVDSATLAELCEQESVVDIAVDPTVEIVEESSDEIDEDE